MVGFDTCHFTRNDKGFMVFPLTLFHLIAILGKRLVVSTLNRNVRFFLISIYDIGTRCPAWADLPMDIFLQG